MNLHDIAAAISVRDDSLRVCVKGSRSNSQAQVHQARVRGYDVRGGQRGSRDERLPQMERNANDGRLNNNNEVIGIL